MKKKNLFFVTFLVAFSFFGYTQNGHTPLKCIGDIPEDFLKLSYQKYEDDKSAISKKDSRSDKKDKLNFYLTSNYQLDRFLQSGNVLFGDELTIYVNKVAGNLLDKNNKTELKEKLRFYVVKSGQVNAFATQQGMIFVTVGLLSQIENEAQLAFVLAHEISHYEKQHNINAYLETQKQRRAHERSRELFENLVKSLSSFSKEQELEADRDGFVMFEKAGYDVEEASSMMLVLQYSHLPFDEIKFDRTFFNAGYYQIPVAKFSDSLNLEIEDNSDEDDSEASHPNIKTRLKEMNELISDETTKRNGKKYLLSEELFHKIQKTARLENLNLNLLSSEYIRVIYEGYLLKKKYPENKFLDKSIAKGLYALSKIKTYAKYYDDEDYEEIVNEYEGESKVLYKFLLSEMSSKEITILALKYMNGLNDKSLEKYKEDLILDLVKKHEFPLSKFAEKYTKPVEKVEVKDTVDISKLSKIEKIKYKNKKARDKVSGKKEYYKLAFIEEMKDSSFVQLFDKMSEKEIKLSEEEIMKGMGYSERQKYIKKRNKEIKKPKSLDIGKIIIIDPVYTLRNSNNQKHLLKSEKKEVRYNVLLANAANKAGVSTTVLSKESYAVSSVDLLNYEALIKEWIGEYSYYTLYHMIPLTNDRISEIKNEFSTSYILLSGVESQKYWNPLQVYNMIYFASLPLAPYAIMKTVVKKHENYYYNILLDINTLEIVMTNLSQTDRKNSEFNTRSILYDVMCQIKKDKK